MIGVIRGGVTPTIRAQKLHIHAARLRLLPRDAPACLHSVETVYPCRGTGRSGVGEGEKAGMSEGGGERAAGRRSMHGIYRRTPSACLRYPCAALAHSLKLADRHVALRSSRILSARGSARGDVFDDVAPEIELDDFYRIDDDTPGRKLRSSFSDAFGLHFRTAIGTIASALVTLIASGRASRLGRRTELPRHDPPAPKAVFDGASGLAPRSPFAAHRSSSTQTLWGRGGIARLRDAAGGPPWWRRGRRWGAAHPSRRLRGIAAPSPSRAPGAPPSARRRRLSLDAPS
ncbi:hypothetical protein C8R45DRAFT_87831 [Mycena sanguinolenta]|nr:hypothetical protein C8R45DRAFT_87831 [Mycena sanguinolenta]